VHLVHATQCIHLSQIEKACADRQAVDLLVALDLQGKMGGQMDKRAIG
jgi:hypothetical protein